MSRALVPLYATICHFCQVQKGKCHVHYFVQKMSRVFFITWIFFEKYQCRNSIFFLGKVCMVLNHSIWCTFVFWEKRKKKSRKSLDATNTPEKNLLNRKDGSTPVKRNKSKYFLTPTLLRKVSQYEKRFYPRKPL